MKRHVNLRQLEAFRAVMLTGSFTKAAKLLGVTQPAISNLISDLEFNFEVRLFERQGNRISPTGEGDIIFEEFEKIHVGLDRLLDVAGRVKQNRRKIVKVGALPVYSTDIAPILISTFYEAEADIYCVLETLSSEALVSDLLAERIDLGITALPLGISTLNEIPLYDEHAVLVLPKGHRLAECPEVGLSQLIDEPFVGLPPSSPFRSVLDQLCNANNFSPTYVVEARTQSSAIRLVALNSGISILNRSIENHAAAAGVVFRPLTETLEWQTGIVIKNSREGEPTLQRFITNAQQADLT